MAVIPPLTPHRAAPILCATAAVRTRIRKADDRLEEMKSKDKGGLFRSFETVQRGTADTSVLAREMHQ